LKIILSGGLIYGSELFFTKSGFSEHIPGKTSLPHEFHESGKAKFFQRYDGFSYEFCHKGKKSESLVYHRRNRFYYPASAPGTESRGTAKNRSSVTNAAEEKLIPVILHTILCAILLIISSYMQKD